MIDGYFTDSITLIKIVKDRWNNETETTTTHPARVEQTRRTLQNESGQDIQSSYLIFIGSDVNVEYTDRIVLGTYTGSERAWSVIRIFSASEFVLNHKEITV